MVQMSIISKVFMFDLLHVRRVGQKVVEKLSVWMDVFSKVFVKGNFRVLLDVMGTIKCFSLLGSSYSCGK